MEVAEKIWNFKDSWEKYAFKLNSISKRDLSHLFGDAQIMSKTEMIYLRECNVYCQAHSVASWLKSNKTINKSEIHVVLNEKI